MTAPLDAERLLPELEVFAENLFVAGPTVREFQRNAELSSTSVAVYHLDRMRDLGWVEHRPEVSRGWTITALGLDAIERLGTGLDAWPERPERPLYEEEQ